MYSVYESGEPPADRTDRAEELRFIRDGFSWSAALFAPLWMLLRGLWLALLIYIAAMVALRFGLKAVGLGGQIGSLLFIAIHILIGFEADTIERWTLARRGWRMVGTVTGKDEIECERRFFDSWLPDQPLLRPDALAASHMMGNGDIGATLSGESRKSGGWRSTFVVNR